MACHKGVHIGGCVGRHKGADKIARFSDNPLEKNCRDEDEGYLEHEHAVGTISGGRDGAQFCVPIFGGGDQG